jgi:hypothetical protein
MSVNAKLQPGEQGQKTELSGRDRLRRQRSTLVCNAIEEEEEEEEKLIGMSWKKMQKKKKKVTRL